MKPSEVAKLIFKMSVETIYPEHLIVQFLIYCPFEDLKTIEDFILLCCKRAYNLETFINLFRTSDSVVISGIRMKEASMKASESLKELSKSMNLLNDKKINDFSHKSKYHN